MLSKSSHTPGCFESFSMIFRRIYHSFGYGILYGFVLVLNLILIIWLVVDRGAPRNVFLFVSLEGAVTIALVLEVIYTLKTQGFRQWISDMLNWFDFMVAVICTMSLAAFATGEQLQGELAVGVASMRYGAQALRLGILLRHARRKNTEGIAEFEQVKFDIVFDSQGIETVPPARTDAQSPNYWGRGRAFSTSPIFQYPKRLSASNLDHTVKVLDHVRRLSLATPPPLSRGSSKGSSKDSLSDASESAVTLQGESDPLI